MGRGKKRKHEPASQEEILRKPCRACGALVLRHMRDGRTIIATRPDYSNHEWTEGQKLHHSRFQEAVAYAKHASRAEPLYAQLAAGTAKNAYNLALSDWFHPPVIHAIMRLPGVIRVGVTDNVQVTEVRVTISDEENRLLEQGQAVQVNDISWEYPTTTPGLARVEACDLAGNIARGEL